MFRSFRYDVYVKILSLLLIKGKKKKKGMKWTMQVSKSYIFDQDVREGQEKKNSFYILGKTKENIPEFL